MANPYFSTYKFKNTEFDQDSGEITDIMVGGDTENLTVTWTGPMGFEETHHVGPGEPHYMDYLISGKYTGIITDENGQTSSPLVIEIKENDRLFLSVDEVIVEEGCHFELHVTSFQHNGLNFKYELLDVHNNPIGEPYMGTPGQEVHSYTSLCAGAYKIRATQTQTIQYVYNGTTVEEVVVEANNQHLFQTKLSPRAVYNIENATKEVFASEDYFRSLGSTTESFIEVMTKENTPINTNCFSVVEEIIKTPKLNGCDEASLRLSIGKKEIVYENTCDFIGFELNDYNGLVLFKHVDGGQDYYIASEECCTGLGFEPELDYGDVMCRWMDPCDNYQMTTEYDENEYMLFNNLETGEVTNYAPNPECCGDLEYDENNGKYHCIAVIPSELTVEPMERGFGYGGNTGAHFYVTSNTEWEVSVDSELYPWIQINSGSGSGNGIADIKILPNDGAARPNGVFHVSTTDGEITRAVKVPQEGVPSTLTVSPLEPKLAAEGGSFTVTVTSNTTWEVVESVSWARIGGASGSEDDTFSVNYDPNTGSTSRDNEEIIVRTLDGEHSKTIILNQPAAAPACSSFIATSFSSGNSGRNMGQICSQTQDDSDETVYRLSGDNVYVYRYSGGQGTSCSARVYGTEVSSFEYYGQTITTTDSKEDIFLFDSDYEFDGFSYSVYTLWYDRNGRTGYLDKVYFVCND